MLSTQHAINNVGSKSSGDHTDIIEKCIGILGKWHLWVCILIFLVKFPVAWHQLNIVFLAPRVNFTCSDNIDKCASNCTSHVFDRSIFKETIITEWDLVCDRYQLASLSQMITMFGILVGNMLLGYLSDKFGRRGPLVGAVIVQLVTGLAAAFVPWFWAFLFFRFLCAAATGGTMITSFVLIMEIVGTKWRTALGILYQIPFNLGHLTLAVFGYLLRDWRYLQLAISAPSVILISYYWLLPESPRWLLAVGQSEKAVEIMEKAALQNKLPKTNIKSDIDSFMQKQQMVERKTGKFSDLVRTPNLRCKTICICFNWIVCGLCFFGVAQYMGHIGGNIFLNVGFSAIVQIPGSLISIWAVKKLGRRYTLMGADVLAGLSCLLIPFVPEDPGWIKPTLGCLGMFALSICFPTVYIYAGELFPTVIRNIGVGTCSMCARIGSMLAPFIAGLGEYEPHTAPLIFGIVPLIGAVLCVKLPETVDCKLPETIQDAELFGKKVKGSPVTNGNAIQETALGN